MSEPLRKRKAVEFLIFRRNPDRHGKKIEEKGARTKSSFSKIRRELFLIRSLDLAVEAFPQLASKKTLKQKAWGASTSILLQYGHLLAHSVTAFLHCRLSFVAIIAWRYVSCTQL